MKFFKNFLIIALLCIINSVQAKRTGAAVAPIQPIVIQPQPQIQPQPKPQPQVQVQPTQPKTTVRTFKQMVSNIKNASTNTVWDATTQILKQNFVNDLVQDARSADLTKDQLHILLTIARDSHAQFTGNNAQDIMILNNINTQIENAL